jgi:hypothetical protein
MTYPRSRWIQGPRDPSTAPCRPCRQASAQDDVVVVIGSDIFAAFAVQQNRSRSTVSTLVNEWATAYSTAARRQKGAVSIGDRKRPERAVEPGQELGCVVEDDDLGHLSQPCRVQLTDPRIRSAHRSGRATRRRSVPDGRGSPRRRGGRRVFEAPCCLPSRTEPGPPRPIG